MFQNRRRQQPPCALSADFLRPNSFCDYRPLAQSFVSLRLAIVGSLAMFPEVVLVVKKTSNGRGLLIDARSEVGHARNGFENDGIVRGRYGNLAPAKTSLSIGYH